MKPKDIVVVTGGAQGMGASHARVLAAEGYGVVVADIREPEGIVAEILQNGDWAAGYSLDVTSEASWQDLVENIESKYGACYGLVNNAGVSYRMGIAETSIEDFERVLSINTTGVFLGMKHLAPLMAVSGGGSIVNISSTAAIIGYHAAAYSASKWAVRGLTRTGAMEFAPDKIRVNSVHPGMTETPMVAGADAFIGSSLESVPLSRSARPKEISEAVSFLISERSSYLTGSEIVVDGGLTSAGTYWEIMNKARAISQGDDL